MILTLLAGKETRINKIFFPLIPKYHAIRILYRKEIAFSVLSCVIACEIEKGTAKIFLNACIQQPSTATRAV